jgi:hypothetical protein
MVDVAHYVRSDAVIPRRVAGETILVPANARTVVGHSRAAELFVLNTTGELLWSELATPKSVPDLARKLIDEYAVSSGDATTDAEEFVRSLQAIGAVTQA